MTAGNAVPGEGVQCEHCAVRSRALCASAGHEGQRELRRWSRIRRVAADETVLPEHGESGFVGTVVAGALRQVKTMPDGREQVVGLVFPGEFFGRPFRARTDFGYEAAIDSEICVTERLAFEAVLRRHPEVEHQLLLQTMNELAAARERSLLLGSLDTLERVATYLLVMSARREQMLSRIGQDPRLEVAASLISRRDLASYLGTTIETISRHVHHLSRGGVIRIIDSSHFEVLDHQRLLAISGVTHDDLRLFDVVGESAAAEPGHARPAGAA
ncbi:MAG: Crp/Fnr family transcriptional regulator [Devosia sp.]|nr:Crp/Fnr family transcriptional regulator [Devosia sp.]